MTRRLPTGKTAGTVLAISLWLLPAPTPAAAPEGPPPSDRSGDESMREDIQETVEIYMIAKMKRFLNLTDQQERTVIPIVEELNATRRETNRKRRLLMLRLHPLIEDEASSEQEIGRVLTELEELDGRLREKEIRARGDIRSALSLRQQAKFLVFQERFRHEMQDRLRRIRQGEGAAGQGPRRPPGPGWQRPRR